MKLWRSNVECVWILVATGELAQRDDEFCKVMPESEQ